MTTYHGSCHCGAVTYEVTADFTEAMRCNLATERKTSFLVY